MHPWKKALILPVTLVMLALGFLIALQIQTQKNVSLAAQITEERMSHMKVVLANSQAENVRLRERKKYLVEQLDEAKESVGTDPALLAELAQLQILDGTQAVEGPGIHITIDDRSRNVGRSLSADDLMKIVNTLRFAGAEAISINDRRVVSTTAIVMSGSSTVLVNEKPINRVEGIPFELNAIGDQETLYDFFTQLEATNLRTWGMSVNVTRKTVQIPSFKGTYTFNYAEPLIN